VGSWQRGCRILVVDDDEGCRQGVASLLAEDGHSVLTAAGGPEALEQAERLRRQNETLHVSILDYHMPDWTGTETFRRLLGVLPGLAAVFLSGEFSETVREDVRRVGGKALLRKPLEIIRVRVVVRQLLAGGQCPGP
jgi:CheY-like chemotaxis protein